MNEKLTEFWRQSKDRSRLNCCRLDFSKTRKDLECNLIQINKMDPGLRAGASCELGPIANKYRSFWRAVYQL